LLPRLVLLSAALGVSLAAANPWGSDTSRTLAKEAFEKRTHGDVAGAIRIYEQGFQQALRTRNTIGQIKFLNSIGGSYYTLYQFQPALKHWTEARQLAEQYSRDPEEHAAILVNLASLYLSSLSLDAAEEAARKGETLLRGYRKAYCRPHLNLILANLAEREAKWDEASYYYAEAMDAADVLGDDITLGLVFNRAANAMLSKGDLAGAERLYLRELQLRKSRKDTGIAYTFVGLGELEFVNGRLDTAYSLTVRAEELAVQGHPIHRHIIHGLKARILNRKGDFPAAHSEFQRAFASIRRTRADVLAADLFRIGAEASLASLYECALRNALDWANKEGSKATAPAELAAEMWLATEEWKSSVASNSNQLKSLAASRLGSEYWQTLAQLRNLEKQSFTQLNPTIGAKLPLLQIRLAEIESAIKIRPLSSLFSENFRAAGVLTLFRNSLRPDEALIRFHVGPKAIVRWTLTHKSLEWREIAITRGELDRMVEHFRTAVQSVGDARDSEVRKAGGELFRLLFGQADPAVRQALHWLLALDGSLLQMPFSALSVEDGRYLVEHRSLELVTGAPALLDRSTGPASGRFVGIGDAVYNTADSRWGGYREGSRGNTPFSIGRLFAQENRIAGTELSLPRLASSRSELETSAQAWKGGVRILTGIEASRGAVVESIESGAGVVHFATHFLQHGEIPDRALLMLSLDGKGQADFFSPQDTVHVRVPDSLVVLSGCHSAAGRIVPAAGVVGMTRAWLMAGASGVIASLWPAPDDNGAIFAKFYRELGSGAKKGSFLRKAAEALREAQLEMLRTRGWRASPKYWGTYQLLGRTA
jgi:CHAT domain-containing protein